MSLINTKTFIICALTSLLGLQSCQNNNKADQKLLQEEVMKTHDALMGDMETLMKSKTALAEMKMNLKDIKQKNSEIDTVMLKKGIEEANDALVASDDAMMAWMNNFNPDYTNKNDEQIIAYLKDQKLKIDSVEASFKKSIAKSNALLIKFQ